jgi:hypothetical protein
MLLIRFRIKRGVGGRNEKSLLFVYTFFLLHRCFCVLLGVFLARTCMECV